MRISTEDVTCLFAKEILSQRLRICGRDLLSTPQESHPLQHSISSVQSLGPAVPTPWTVAHQASRPSPILELAQTHVHRVGDGHPAILSSVVPFSCLQSLPASQSFPVTQFFASGGQSVGVTASAAIFPVNI